MRVRLGDLARIKTGKLDANASSADGAYPFFTCSRDPLKISSYSYDCECVLVAGNGDLNVKYYKGKFDAYQRTYIIEDNGSGRLYMPYLYFFLDSYLEELRKQSIGGVIKYIKLGNLTEALIELPDLAVQEEIVRILKALREILSARQRQLSALDDLIKARFVEMFGDQNYMVRSLADVIVPGAGLSYGIIVPGDYYENGCPMVRPSDFKNNKLDLTNVYRVDPAIEKQYARTRLQGDEILVQVIGQPGQIIPATEECKGMNVTRNLAVVRPNNRLVNRQYLIEYLRSETAQRYLTGSSKQSTLKQLPLSLLKTLEVPIPPMELQAQFSVVVSQIDKSKSVIQKSLDETQLLFDSLMQKYFG